MIRLKRVYEQPSPEDGERILVERLWPRGLTKAAAKVELWLKDISPSPELRKWFSHDPEKWQQFKVKYRRELEKQSEAIDLLRQKARLGQVTFVYAARDEERNSALLLKEFIESKGRNS